MEIKSSIDNDTLTVCPIGKMDTNSSPEVEAFLKSSLDGIKTLVFDFSELDYISSTGLRVLLSAQKRMNQQGSMIVKNVKPDVEEILELTGFTEILTIE